MDIFNILTLIGGLSLFLFGMNIMGTALEKRAGSKLKNILSRLTSSKFKGVLLGLIVTAIIQSSSATTVMVVGFVNSGIMTLKQTIGIIMGANIGTTVTAWILSLTGIESSNIFIRLLNPSSFTPVLALIGIIFYMFMKSSKKKDTGMILLGFAVLMFGMKTMSDSVAPLSEVEEFKNILLLFANPIFGILAGTFLTAIIQSSSASVGILQALSLTGQVSFGSAIPIIMGSNIGSCATALISSVGTNKNAKRAAMVHLYFNIIGTAFWLTAFYLLNYFVKFDFLLQNVSPVSIAVIHTIFNILCMLLLFPLSGLLEKLANLTVRNSKEAEKFQILDERLLKTPSIALERCKNVTFDMAQLATDTLKKSFSLISNFDSKLVDKIKEQEEKVDKYEDKLGTYLVKLSSRNMSISDSRETSKILHLISDFERLSDHAVNISESAIEMHDKKIVFSKEATDELKVMFNAVDEILNLSLKAFKDNDLKTATLVEPLEQVVDYLQNELKTHHIARLQKSKCTIELGFIFLDLLTNLERVADHCSNIAICIIETAHHSFKMHKYLNEVKSKDNLEFSENYKTYLNKYRLN